MILVRPTASLTSMHNTPFRFFDKVHWGNTGAQHRCLHFRHRNWENDRNTCTGLMIIFKGRAISTPLPATSTPLILPAGVHLRTSPYHSNLYINKSCDYELQQIIIKNYKDLKIKLFLTLLKIIKLELRIISFLSYHALIYYVRSKYSCVCYTIVFVDR